MAGKFDLLDMLGGNSISARTMDGIGCRYVRTVAFTRGLLAGAIFLPWHCSLSRVVVHFESMARVVWGAALLYRFEGDQVETDQVDCGLVLRH